MNNQIVGDKKQNIEMAQLSLDVISLMIALAYKWDKTEYKDRIGSWVKDFANSLSDDEKQEFQKEAQALGLEL